MVFNVDDKFDQNFFLSPEVYRGFMEVFGDRNPLHTDDEFAVKHRFEKKVMHGNILNGFLSYFIGECLPVKNIVIHSQEIVFKKPVYLNDRLFLAASVTHVSPGVGVVEFKFQFRNLSQAIVAKGTITIGILI